VTPLAAVYKEQSHVVARRRRRISPITRRILAINIVAVLIPIGGLLYLGPYRDGLIDSELEALRLQADTFAGAIGEGAIEITPKGLQLVNLQIARQIVWRLSAPSGIRSRLFAPNGALIADSRYLMGTHFAVQVQELPPSEEPNWVIRIASQLINWVSSLLPENKNFERFIEKQNQSAADFVEVREALAGDIKGNVRLSETEALILSVAVPVQRYRHVLGALMVSKDDTAVKAAMSEVRLTVVAVFGAALVVTILLSIYLAGTLARPVLRLATAAERVRRGLGRGSEEIPDFTGRNDEIGDLSGVLREMTESLHDRMDAIERFAADVSHEIKNPLTSLRSAVETAARISDPDQQKKLMNIIQEDVQRLDRLITDISNASRLDSELSRAETETIDMAAMLQALCDIYMAGDIEIDVSIEILGEPPFRAKAIEDRLVQVFRNLIQNAISFSPQGGRVVMHLSRREADIKIDVIDEGPGLPEGKLEAIFDRFYSERPEGEKFGTHSGLGLSISRQIMKAHGGSVRAVNEYKASGTISGARFIVHLPIAED
jgi:two-component system sensor histidine kinase ChvG